MQLRAESTNLRQTLRQREIETVFGRVPENAFDCALELGAGDGFQSHIISRCARVLLSTDINPARLEYLYDSKIRYQICDAENLPYREAEFDLIYSSNLLEHLMDPACALAGMCRVLRDDGVMIHTIPNQFWKILHLGLFYPSRVLALIEVLTGDGVSRSRARGNNFKSSRRSFFARNLWPPPHGVSSSNILEFRRFAIGTVRSA